MPRLILPVKSTAENAAYDGLQNEVVIDPEKGMTIHDGKGKHKTIPFEDIHHSDQNIVRNGTLASVMNGTSWQDVAGGHTYIFDGWFGQLGGGSKFNAASMKGYQDGLNVNRIGTITTFSGGGADSFTIFSQRYPDVDFTAGKRLTISFYMKCSSTTSIAVEFGQSFKSVTPNKAILVGRVPINTEYELHTLTFDVPELPSDAVITGDSHYYLYFWLEAGDNYNDRTGGILPFSGSFRFSDIRMGFGDKMCTHQRTQWEEEEAVGLFFEKNAQPNFAFSAGMQKNAQTNGHATGGANHYHTFSVNNTVMVEPRFVHKKWVHDLTNKITYETEFMNNPSLYWTNKGGFCVLGSANDQDSAARITSYTVDAEIKP